MLVKFLIEDGEISEFRDLYINPNKISAFYIPHNEDGVLDNDCINVLFDGDFMTFKAEPHLTEYLLKSEMYAD